MNDGTWIRNGHEADARHGKRLSSLAPNTKSLSHRSSPGILIFSHKGQLLHMNHRAMELTGHLNLADTGPATVMLSKGVSDLRTQIQDTLDGHLDANVLTLFELKRFISEFGRKILLRGFGLPNRNASGHSRVLIILEEVSLQQQSEASQAHAKVQSSDKEGAAA